MIAMATKNSMSTAIAAASMGTGVPSDSRYATVPPKPNSLLQPDMMNRIISRIRASRMISFRRLSSRVYLMACTFAREGGALACAPLTLAERMGNCRPRLAPAGPRHARHSFLFHTGRFDALPTTWQNRSQCQRAGAGQYDLG